MNCEKSNTRKKKKKKRKQKEKAHRIINNDELISGRSGLKANVIGIFDEGSNKKATDFL